MARAHPHHIAVLALSFVSFLFFIIAMGAAGWSMASTSISGETITEYVGLWSFVAITSGPYGSASQTTTIDGSCGCGSGCTLQGCSEFQAVRAFAVLAFILAFAALVVQGSIFARKQKLVFVTAAGFHGAAAVAGLISWAIWIDYNTNQLNQSGSTIAFTLSYSFGLSLVATVLAITAAGLTMAFHPRIMGDPGMPLGNPQGVVVSSTGTGGEGQKPGQPVSAVGAGGSAVVVAGGVAAAPGVGRWSTGLCDLDGNCVYACFCGPCFYGDVSTALDPTGQWCGECCIFYLTAGWINCCFRTKVRNRYGIPGDQCEDCLISMYCAPCFMSQAMREIKIRGNGVGAQQAGVIVMTQQPVYAQPQMIQPPVQGVVINCAACRNVVQLPPGVTQGQFQCPRCGAVQTVGGYPQAQMAPQYGSPQYGFPPQQYGGQPAVPPPAAM